MKKKLLLTMILISSFVAGCAGKSADDATPQSTEQTQNVSEEQTAAAESAGIANPWKDTDKDGVQAMLGFGMNVPDGSENISYQVNEIDGMAQVVFTYGEPEQEYTYRMKSSAEFEDISGLNYTWDVENDASIQWCEAKTKRVKADDKTIDLCLWYDVVPGVMYSLSVSASDLDGFDITAIAEQIFEPLQGEVEGMGDGVEHFIPSNFLEAKLQRDTFESYDEVISLLDKDNAYARVKIYGYDQELLVIAEGAYDNGDGKMAAIEASVYKDTDGVVKNIGNIYSSGTAYPISQDSEGKIYSGGNHEVNVECISLEYTSVMQMIYAYESFDESGNVTYGGFIRETNSLDGEDKEIAADDPSVLENLYKEFEKTVPIEYTVVA